MARSYGEVTSATGSPVNLYSAVTDTDRCPDTAQYVHAIAKKTNSGHIFILDADDSSLASIVGIIPPPTPGTSPTWYEDLGVPGGVQVSQYWMVPEIPGEGVHVVAQPG